jgi:hypothetical protein
MISILLRASLLETRILLIMRISHCQRHTEIDISSKVAHLQLRHVTYRNSSSNRFRTVTIHLHTFNLHCSRIIPVHAPIQPVCRRETPSASASRCLTVRLRLRLRPRLPLHAPEHHGITGLGRLKPCPPTRQHPPVHPYKPHTTPLTSPGGPIILLHTQCPGFSASFRDPTRPASPVPGVHRDPQEQAATLCPIMSIYPSLSSLLADLFGS